ncbi:MAG: UvrD-helicase domain-containing protein [bacterium]
MKDFIADLHIHSHYSRATSKDCIPEELFRWACLKGIFLLGTGDFTHPGWLEELDAKLVPAEEEGLYALRNDLEQEIIRQVPLKCRRDIRFIFSAEVSSIYKKEGKTRKIHNVILVPSIDIAKKISCALGEIGNIHSDGRPILGLDSKILLDLCLEICPEVIFIPAHIWTPHFSLFGAYSGFDRLEDCFEDLSDNIYALETGLSSDPAMNYRLSALDKYNLVSNSDAHSGKNLAREGNYFKCEPSYRGIRAALIDKSSDQFKGTFEFFPEEGKYHFDGHRNCGIRWSPEETIKADGLCPKCGKKITCGVMHRVDALADREMGLQPEGSKPYDRLIPLPEILANYFACGVNTKKVNTMYFRLLHNIGNEWHILTQSPFDELKSYTNAVIAEGIIRVRNGKVKIKPGFDGEYGHIEVFSKEELAHKKGFVGLLSPEKKSEPKRIRRKKKAEDAHIHRPSHPSVKKTDSSYSHNLNSLQKICVEESDGPVIVRAGPGTGKTRTLIYRIADLVQSKGVSVENIIAVTFTRKAASEMKDRLTVLFKDTDLCRRLWLGTFHQICGDILRKYGSFKDFRLFQPHDCLALLERLIKRQFPESTNSSSKLLQKISFYKTGRAHEPFLNKEEKIFFDALIPAYKKALSIYNALDYDDLIITTVDILSHTPSLLDSFRSQFNHILIDEFQDIDPIQYKLILLLAGNGKGLFAIGDPDQSIYKFRGADYRIFFQIEKDFAHAKVYNLTHNYRSSGTILAAADKVISHNRARGEYGLKAERASGSAIRILTLPNEKAEAIAVTKEIEILMGGTTMLSAHGQALSEEKEIEGKREWGEEGEDLGELGFSDFAVLFRTGTQASILEECFIKAGIPYRLVGHKSILDNKEVRELIAFLKLCLDPTDIHSLLQVLHLPLFSEISEADKRRLFLAEEHHVLQSIDLPGTLPVLLNKYCEAVMHKSPACIIASFIDEVGFNASNLHGVVQLAEGFSDLSSFLDQAFLYREGDFEWRGKADRDQPEVVSLMTLHAAKGLEFPVVFICGMEEGLFPWQRKNSKEENDIEEERRLFYVGITRAKALLYLLHATMRRSWGKVIPQKESSFLTEIPLAICQRGMLKKRVVRKKPKQLSLW